MATGACPRNRSGLTLTPDRGLGYRADEIEVRSRKFRGKTIVTVAFSQDDRVAKFDTDTYTEL